MPFNHYCSTAGCVSLLFLRQGFHATITEVVPLITMFRDATVVDPGYVYNSRVMVRLNHGCYMGARTEPRSATWLDLLHLQCCYADCALRVLLPCVLAAAIAAVQRPIFRAHDAKVRLLLAATA